MNNRLRIFMVLWLATVCALAAATTATAATTHSKLRVEATGSTLDAGTNYSNGAIRTQNSSACGPRNSARERLRGANAMGLVGHASKVNRALRPFRTSDTFGSQAGRVVCEVGSFKGFGNRAWLFRVNHRFASVSGDRTRVGRGDEVLWYYANFNTGRNTGDELGLRQVPAAVRPGQQFQVRALSYAADGSASPAVGVKVTGAPVTNPTGVTTVTARSAPGTMLIRGTRGNDVPTEPLAVCVARNLARCPDRRGETYIGTPRADDIRGGAAPDVIRPGGGRDVVSSRRGDDLVRVRGGGRDRVNCGAGSDVVQADTDDRVEANCEVVRRG